MIAWCPLACWLTHDLYFNEGRNKGHYSVSVGSRPEVDGKMKGPSSRSGVGATGGTMALEDNEKQVQPPCVTRWLW